VGSSSPKKIYLIDGTSNLFRAFYAIRRLTGPGGIPTNATFGFTQMLRKFLQTERPQYVAVAFDRPEPTHRHELFIRYKANRQAPPEDLILQIPDVKNVCRALGVAAVELPGYEADDLIGTLSRRAAADGFEVMIVGSDKDLLQLVDDSTRILHPSSGEVLGAEGVRNRFGVTPRQVVEVLALMGDASDNIPGVPGIGEKGARDLIARYGDLEGCLQHAGEIERKSYRENLLAFQDQARLSRDLARIHLDAPVTWDPALFVRREPSREEMRRVFQELGFSRLLEENGAEAAPGDNRDVPHSEGSGVVQIVRDAGALRALAEAPSHRGRLAFVPLFSSQEPMRATLTGLTLASEPGRSIHIPTVQQGSNGSTGLTENEILEALRPLWTDAGVRKIAANLKAFEVFLLRHAMTLSGPKLDTTVAAYLLEPERLDYSVFGLASAYLGWPSHSVPVKPRAGRFPAPAERAVEEAAEGAACQCQALLALEDILSQRMSDADLGRLYREVEVPLLSVLAEMEWTGVRVDVAFLHGLSARCEKDLRDLERKIHEMAGHEFNIQSPRQLREVLFGKLGLKPGRKTDKEKSYSTGVDVLEDLARVHPLPAALLEYRGLAKLRSNYLEAIPRLVNPATGRVHASFNQAAAATGRLSSSGPNLQNIPVRSETGRQIRRAFVAEEGWRILTADYSQIELRVLAHLSRDPEMVHAFHAGEDIHVRTASEVFGVPQTLVTPDLRRQAKAINFGIIYGMGAFRLSRELGVPTSAAQRFIDGYFERFAGVQRYVQEVVSRAERDGYVSTLMGRIRPVPEIRSRNATLRRQGIRVAVNTTIQGSAADLIKIAMVHLDRALKAENMKSRLLIQVHDELVLEAPEQEAERTGALVRAAMEGCYPLEVSLQTEVRSGPNWLDTV